MKELQEILAAWQLPENIGQPMAVATLVQVEGSAYRRPGARMLICNNGERIGALSGGCLEADVTERARHVMTTGEPQLAQYNPHSGYDLVVEMGCRGAVSILIEPISASSLSLRFLESCLQSRRPGAMATVFHVDGNPSINVGTRVTWVEGTWEADDSDGACGSVLAAELAAMETGGQARTKSYSFGNGRIDVLLEPVLPPIALLICGAGQDAVPLAQFAALLGWQITVVDARPDLLTSERFPAAHQRKVIRMEEGGDAFQRNLKLDARTVAVVMTHNYCEDMALLQHLLPASVHYIGLLGPRRRAERILDELAREGISFSPDTLARLHSPAGLDIGSESPEEIALAIIAEIQAALAGRNGGFLKQRNGPIHASADRTTEPLNKTLPVGDVSCVR